MAKHKLNEGLIKARIEAIVSDNKEYINKGSLEEYIKEGNDQWYYVFLDDSKCECTGKNINRVVEIIRSYETNNKG